MPMCMACNVCSMSYTPLGIWALKSSYWGIGNSGNGFCIPSAGPLMAGNNVQLKGRRNMSRGLPRDRRQGLIAVRAEASGNDGSGTTTTTTTPSPRVTERSEADALVDGMSFGELCDDFQCVSSPSVEATARLLVRDILEIRDGNRAFATYAIFVKYKDPLRSFTGRNKYQRPSWIRATIENPIVAVQEMVMISTSILKVKWTVRGRPRLPPASILGGDLVLAVTSVFTLNQISGQVIEQVDDWDLSKSSLLSQAYFWATRLSYSAVEAGKDAGEAVAGIIRLLDKGKDDDRSSYYPDPSGDPRKFFQVEDNPQKDLYQVGLVIALIYLLVQFLKFTL